MSREKQNKGIKGEKGTIGPPGVCPSCRVYGPTISWDADTGVSTCTCGWSSEEGRDKQIEKMAKVIAVARGYGCTEKRSCDMSCQVYKYGCLPYEDAEILYNAGYRKQSEGVWELEHETYGEMRCSVCGKECPTERKPNPYASYRMDDFYIASPFCPNCGAKMKGGAG